MVTFYDLTYYLFLFVHTKSRSFFLWIFNEGKFHHSLWFVGVFSIVEKFPRETHECISMKFLLLKRTNRIEVCILGESFSWRKRGGGGLFRIRSLCLIISTLLGKVRKILRDGIFSNYLQFFRLLLHVSMCFYIF